MNRIDDERVKFFLEHEARIREWAGLERQVIKFVDRFYRSLRDDLDEALKAGRIREGGVSSFLEGRDWPGVGLRRQSWPGGDGRPNVRLEWQRKKALFPPRGHLVVGISTNVDRYRVPFTKETCPDYPRSSRWWPAYRGLKPPQGRFWEGDNLQEYRKYLVDAIFTAWNDLAPLMDEAVSGPPG